MELAKTDYTASDCKEPELNEALRMIERRDDEIARLHTELATLRADLETLHTLSQENALMLDDIRLPLFKLLKDPLGAMVSGEIAEQLKNERNGF